MASKELECAEDPGSAGEAARAGHFTLDQCLQPLHTAGGVGTRRRLGEARMAGRWAGALGALLLTMPPQVLPAVQTAREASKQLLLWRLPNVLIVQLQACFASLQGVDRDLVEFPVR